MTLIILAQPSGPSRRVTTSASCPASTTTLTAKKQVRDEAREKDTLQAEAMACKISTMLKEVLDQTAKLKKWK
jgi:hypothetical protein